MKLHNTSLPTDEGRLLRAGRVVSLASKGDVWMIFESAILAGVTMFASLILSPTFRLMYLRFAQEGLLRLTGHAAFTFASRFAVIYAGFAAFHWMRG